MMRTAAAGVAPGNRGAAADPAMAAAAHTPPPPRRKTRRSRRCRPSRGASSSWAARAGPRRPSRSSPACQSWACSRTRPRRRPWWTPAPCATWGSRRACSTSCLVGGHALTLAGGPPASRPRRAVLSGIPGGGPASRLASQASQLPQPAASAPAGVHCLPRPTRLWPHPSTLPPALARPPAGDFLEPDEVTFAVLLRGYGSQDPPAWQQIDATLTAMKQKYAIEPSHGAPRLQQPAAGGQQEGGGGGEGGRGAAPPGRQAGSPGPCWAPLGQAPRLSGTAHPSAPPLPGERPGASRQLRLGALQPLSPSSGALCLSPPTPPHTHAHPPWAPQ
jgi:hypothetical protein